MIAVPAGQSGPPDTRPPGHPKPPTNPRPPKTTGAAVAAGPAAPPTLRPGAGRPSNHPSASGECLTPGSGAAAPVAVTESAAVVVARSAGANARRAEVSERPSTRLGFTLPPTPRPPEFQIGSADIRRIAAASIALSLHRRSR